MAPEDREALVVDHLREIEWPVSPKLFDALLRAIPTVAFEVVVIAEVPVKGSVFGKRELKVALLPRPPDDPFFAGKVHGPGTVMRRGDTEASALARALREVGSGVTLSSPRFVGVEHVPMGTGEMECLRGQEIGLLYYVVWEDGDFPPNVTLENYKRLPENIIGFHRTLVRRAVEHYKSRE